MRRTIMGLAAIALLFTSCSKNEVATNAPKQDNDENLIGFSSYTGSRAADNNIDNLKSGFTVIAEKSPSGGVAELFNGIYKFDNSVWAWPDKDPKYNWPTNIDDYPLTFASLYPKAGFTYTNKDVAITIDQLAKNQLDYISATSGPIEKKPINDLTTMAFKHILSKIQFSVKSAAGFKVNVQSIKIVNVQDQTSRTLVPTFNPFTGDWINPITDAANNAYVNYNFRTTAATAVDGESIAGVQTVEDGTAVLITGNSGSLMLMPQYGTQTWDVASFTGYAKTAVVEWEKLSDKTDPASWLEAVNTANSTSWNGSRIEVVYNVQKTDNSYTVGGAGQFVRVGYLLDLSTIDATKSWVTNKQYTYTIGLAGEGVSGGILLDPFYTDQNGVPKTDAPVENPLIYPGDPVNVSSTIGFDVKVDGWDNGSTNLN